MTSCNTTPLGSLIDKARQIATLEVLAAHYGIVLTECGNCNDHAGYTEDGGTKQKSKCPLPSHLKGSGEKKMRWYCDPAGNLRFWRCFDANCRKTYEQKPLGCDAIAFIAQMEGVGRDEAARMVCDGLLSVPAQASIS